MSLEDRIKGHEGLSTKPYYCTADKLTIGYGRNLGDVGITEDEADYLFRNDLKRAIAGAETFYVYEFLNKARRGVLIEMVFQLGVKGVGGFKKFLSAALQQKWQEAHDEMKDSKWHDQTPERCDRLAKIFLEGVE